MHFLTKAFITSWFCKIAIHLCGTRLSHKALGHWPSRTREEEEVLNLAVQPAHSQQNSKTQSQFAKDNSKSLHLADPILRWTSHLGLSMAK